jgi:hypothetical protein
MPVMGGGIHAMWLPGNVGRVWFSAKLGMTELIAHFASNDLPIFNRSYQVIACTSKVLADGFSIISDGCNFHKNLHLASD